MGYLNNTKFYIEKADLLVNPVKANIIANNYVSLNDVVQNITEGIGMAVGDFLPLVLEEDISVVREYSPTKSASLAWVEPVPGFNALVMAVANQSNPTRTANVLVADVYVGLNASSDINDHRAEVELTDTDATMSFTKVGGGNTTITTQEAEIILETDGSGKVLIDSPKVTINSERVTLSTTDNTAVFGNRSFVITDNSDVVYLQPFTAKASHNATGNITANVSDTIIKGTASGADITLSLPAAATTIGTKYYIFNEFSSTHNVLVAPQATESINGNSVTPVTIQPGRGIIFVVYDAAGWFCSFI